MWNIAFLYETLTRYNVWGVFLEEEEEEKEEVVVVVVVSIPLKGPIAKNKKLQL